MPVLYSLKQQHMVRKKILKRIQTTEAPCPLPFVAQGLPVTEHVSLIGGFHLLGALSQGKLLHVLVGARGSAAGQMSCRHPKCCGHKNLLG